MSVLKYFRLLAGRQTPDQLGDLSLIPHVVAHSVDYVKSTAGAPSGTATSGEKCFNTNDKKIYSYTTLWDAGTLLTSGLKAIHKDTGSDTSGSSGVHTASNKIYTIDPVNDSVFETSAAKGMRAIIEDESNTAYEFIASWTQATNDFQNADRVKVPVIYKFAFMGGFPASQTDVAIYEINGSFQQILMPAAGSIVKATMQGVSARTAGTLTGKPAINGVAAGSSALNMVFDGTTTNDDKAEAAAGVITFSAGDKIGLLLTSDGSWAPVNIDIEATLYVVFNT